MLRSVARLLWQFGYASLLFPSAEAFTNHSDFGGVACVILDINLGDGSGLELRRRLTAANISVPVIFITGNDNPTARTAALQSGCLAYLTKPFSAQSLMGPLKRASPPLSPREKQLLRRFAAGKTDEQIASKLGGTVKQVAECRARLLAKLKITSEAGIAEAAKRLAALASYRGAS